MMEVIEREALIAAVEQPIRAARNAHAATSPPHETIAPTFRATVVRAFEAGGLPVALAPFPVLAYRGGEPWVLLRYPVWPACIDAVAPSLSAILCPQALA